MHYLNALHAFAAVGDPIPLQGETTVLVAVIAASRTYDIAIAWLVVEVDVFATGAPNQLGTERQFEPRKPLVFSVG